ncbi:hypothetical protein [Paenibacillus phytorum]|uniref:hypothetical protein n=1 Tax=Paenibacillus phytorum TaxID=2654977 RepID=UPI001C101A1F|nr:hypothetical protein [Paenibacillus phytorum]
MSLSYFAVKRGSLSFCSVACILTFITEIPTDKNISGVHCIPVLENGNLIMTWDKDEKVLTTIGGRLDKDESINEGLDRELKPIVQET